MSASREHETRELAFRRLLREKFGVEGEAEAPLPDDGVIIPRDRHVALAAALQDAGWRLYVTCVATHFPAVAGKKTTDASTPEHLEVATVLRTVGAGSHIARWRVRVGLDEPLDSLTPIFAGADWQEREQYDLVGVHFAGHPDLRRLMMPEDWVGHPLRRDYAIDTPHAPWR